MGFVLGTPGGGGSDAMNVLGEFKDHKAASSVFSASAEHYFSNCHSPHRFI